MSKHMYGVELYELSATFKRAAGEARGKADKAVRKTAIDIQNTGKVYAPYRTGNLKDSITTDIQSGPTGVTAEIGPTAEYGAHVEYGTSVQRPQPYMRPAADRHVPLLEEALAQAIEDSLS